MVHQTRSSERKHSPPSKPHQPPFLSTSSSATPANEKLPLQKGFQNQQKLHQKRALGRANLAADPRRAMRGHEVGSRLLSSGDPQLGKYGEEREKRNRKMEGWRGLYRQGGAGARRLVGVT